MKKTTRKRIRSLFVMLLAATLLFTFSAGVAAAEAKTVHEQILDTGAEYGTSEYYAFTKAWSDYFLSLLPTDKEPEALKRLTLLPKYDDEGAWFSWFSGGGGKNHETELFLRNEVFRIAEKLDLTSSALSLSEKASRINKYCDSLEYRGRNIKYGLARGEYTDENGYHFNCDTYAMWLVALHRLAGIPATNNFMELFGINHTECFVYVDNAWRFAKDHSVTFTEYFSSMANRHILGAFSFVHDSYGLEADNSILDVDEEWIGRSAEGFISRLLQKPFVYPEEELTRGMVAKLLCHYLGVVPMRNEFLFSLKDDLSFSDVPASHEYAPYIWAMNKLGIMGGVGGGKFSPNAGLTMQEFAVMGYRVMEYRIERINASSKQQLEDIRSNPEDWPLDSIYTQAVIERLERESDYLSTRFGSSIREPKVFVDNDKIATWAKSAVDKFSSLDILSGDGTGYLKPTETLSKVRFLVFLYKFNDRLGFYDGGLSAPLF
ncbi:MAG: transglutaminase-like domain-containing protein [Oscillospiraceae bacterium]|jgi:hypothetical protein|nr:transglutaminase-like domain-containing protein [Oscillospiraceae bacterium]